MNDSHEPSSAMEDPSPNAMQMLALENKVLAEWEKRLRASVPEAQWLPHPVLINTFPVFYESIAAAISPSRPQMAIAATILASEHGSERARLTDYNSKAIISEFQLLRWAIFDVLKRNGVRLDVNEFTIVNAMIDDAIQESVVAFLLVESAMRERLIAMVTHDLRNPLAVAYSSAQLIMHLDDPIKIKEMTSKIIKNLGRMDAMIKQMLNVAVFHVGDRLKLDLNTFDMVDLANEIRSEFESTYGTRLEQTGVSVVGCWDSQAIRRTIENLLGNAVKYGTPGSLIRLDIRSEHGRMILTVHNEGKPIPREEMESVFQVFRRAAAAKVANKEGWGIGLPFVRSVAESHGGSVIAESGAEQGTTFGIDIPIDSTPFQDAPTVEAID